MKELIELVGGPKDGWRYINDFSGTTMIEENPLTTSARATYKRTDRMSGDAVVYEFVP